jgi:hypothetical protein
MRTAPDPVERDWSFADNQQLNADKVAVGEDSGSHSGTRRTKRTYRDHQQKDPSCFQGELKKLEIKGRKFNCGSTPTTKRPEEKKKC